MVPMMDVSFLFLNVRRRVCGLLLFLLVLREVDVLVVSLALLVVVQWHDPIWYDLVVVVTLLH